MFRYLKLGDDKWGIKGKVLKKRTVRMMGAIPFKTEERETWLLVKETRGGFKEEEVIQ